jgi:hypothetical protein
VVACQTNSFCPQDVPDSIPCPQNTRSSAGAGALTDCIALPGFYGPPGATATQCSANSYCAGDGSIVACPLGTEAPSGAISLSSCKVLAGFYGDALQSVHPCPANTNSISRSSYASACLAIGGFYGQPGEEPSLCPEVRFCSVLFCNCMQNLKANVLRRMHVINYVLICLIASYPVNI